MKGSCLAVSAHGERGSRAEVGPAGPAGVGHRVAISSREPEVALPGREIDPELLPRQRAPCAEGVECLGLPVARIQRDHRLGPGRSLVADARPPVGRVRRSAPGAAPVPGFIFVRSAVGRDPEGRAGGCRPPCPAGRPVGRRGVPSMRAHPAAREAIEVACWAGRVFRCLRLFSYSLVVNMGFRAANYRRRRVPWRT